MTTSEDRPNRRSLRRPWRSRGWAVVQIWSGNRGANEQWLINADGTITGVQSKLCLDWTGSATTNGGAVELRTCNGGSNQRWTKS
ncbi:ricin-type beta-trefoil lectin domain protein [Actinoplanes sp. NPDC051513]|uniref:ricin-type beta-trefoil lectin domain protein n=1 Tax=Actinoplanes sp. NPDC051513 TaxID=3363908 RepID=UPI00379EEC8F